MGNSFEKPMWSESRVKLARSCLRAYFFSYYQSQNGWLPTASPEARQAYTLKKMTSLPMWIGSIVHDTIQHALCYRRASGGNAIMPIRKAEEEATQALRKGWLDSTQKRWQKSPSKAVNLQEHYYGQNVDQKKCEDLKAKIMRCLQALYGSVVFERINSVPVEDWLTLEEFQSFTMNTGEEVSVKIDFGFRYDGLIWLIDWKTGKPSDAVLDQLVTYAMYAIRQGWAQRPQDIVIVPVYLDVADRDKMAPELSVAMPHLARQAETIRREYPMLMELHASKDDINRFPVTDDESACRFCNFKAICPGPCKEIPDGKTPF